MATLTIECERGTVAIEADRDEEPTALAARLADAINAAGGRKGERIDPPRPPTRDERMSAWGKLECKACGVWVMPSARAAEHHMQKYHPEESRPGA